MIEEKKPRLPRVPSQALTIVHSELASRQNLPALLVKRGYELGVEVGSQRGEYAEYLLAGWPGKLYMIDPWEQQPDRIYHDVANVERAFQEQFMQEARNRVSKFGDRAVIVREYSPAAASRFDDGSFDFMYLDGNHSHEATLADLRAWWPKLKSGGLMAGHDFVDDAENSHGCRFGVKSAVTQFLTEMKLPLEVSVSEGPWPQWSFDKSQ